MSWSCNGSGTKKALTHHVETCNSSLSGDSLEEWLAVKPMFLKALGGAKDDGSLYTIESSGSMTGGYLYVKIDLKSLNTIKEPT